jgi:hypothetical protein
MQRAKPSSISGVALPSCSRQPHPIARYGSGQRRDPTAAAVMVIDRGGYRLQP